MDLKVYYRVLNNNLYYHVLNVYYHVLNVYYHVLNLYYHVLNVNYHVLNVNYHVLNVYYNMLLVYFLYNQEGNHRMDSKVYYHVPCVLSCNRMYYHVLNIMY